MSCYSHWHPPLVVTLVSFLNATALFSQMPPPVRDRFPILLESGEYTSPREGPNLADLNHDGNLEILVASKRKVYAFQSDGTLLPGWPQATTHEVREPPVVGDLDHDGYLDVVAVDISYDVDGSHTHESFLYAWTNDGSIFPNFPLALRDGFNPLALYDLDKDEDLEIIGGFGTRVFVFHHNGATAAGWPQEIAPFYPIAKPSIGDIDSDGEPEIVIPGQYAADRFEDYLGRLYVWRANGETSAGWPVTLVNNYTFAASNDAVLVDVNGDSTLEIAVGTFKFIPPIVRGFAALYRYDGLMMPGWPQFTAASDSFNGFQSGPAAADLDNDGFPDLIFGDGFDHLIAWKGDGTLVPGWPVVLGEIGLPLVGQVTLSNPSVGDIDGDGKLEIFRTSPGGATVDSIWMGSIPIFKHDGKLLSWILRLRQTAGFNSVALGDLDFNGSVDIIALSDGRSNLNLPKETWLTVWEIPGVPYVEERFPWPMFGHDRWHTSQYGFKPPDEPTVAVREREGRNQLPQNFVLHQNYPNPFYATSSVLRGLQNQTEIGYELPVTSHVDLRIFNLLGEEVRRLVEATQTAGIYKTFWEGRDERGNDLPAGIYFYRMEATPQARTGKSFSSTKKLTKLN